ncbi:MAG: protein-export chaperone SecB [Sphingomonas sp.]|nr:protein-export chaperone SecB [Sphingomonas sp.]
MDDHNDAGATGTAQGNGADTMPSIGIISQYVKDLSFENPTSPAIYQNQTPPRVDVQFNIGATQVGDELHEVVLKIDARSDAGDQVAFVVDLSYAGLFALNNIPEDQIQPFLLGEAPRILFPFARRILADAVRDGGFAPLMLEPIDFNALYFQQIQGQIAEGQSQDVGHA